MTMAKKSREQLLHDLEQERQMVHRLIWMFEDWPLFGRK